MRQGHVFFMPPIRPHSTAVRPSARSAACTPRPSPRRGGRGGRALAPRLALIAALASAPVYAQEPAAMTAPALPSPIDAFVAAVNRGDAETALAFFGRDGVVDDWGTRYVGAAAIAQWSVREFVGAKGRLTPTRVSRDGERIVVDAGWASSFYSGDSRFVFTVDGQRIREMRIVGH